MGESLEGVRWGELKSHRADLAEAGRSLLYQYGVGLAFLGTVRPDGGPRLHPICPLSGEDGLYTFVIPSPKRTDLVRDGRFALHSFAAEDNEDAFYVTGRAVARGRSCAARGDGTPVPSRAPQSRPTTEGSARPPAL
jgi:hypothetical protein